MRRTKIVATLGPATDPPGVLEQMFGAGLDLARLNYSHGARAEHARRARRVRELSHERKRPVGLIADLQGPKIRLAKFRDGPIQLEEGDPFVIDAELGPAAGDRHRVGVTYKALARDVQVGDHLVVDDGRIILRIERIAGHAIETVVLLGGPLSDHKGINREGGGLSLQALTRKDYADIRHAVSIGADYIAVSFVRTAGDVEAARRRIQAAGGTVAVIAKIERADALEHIQEILQVADGIMIARGDLGVEIGDSRLPPVQKQLIDEGRRRHRAVITATQMMNSMIENPIPTRAEVFDVANAVLDGTDAVMLSGETSIGRYPAKTVAAMSRICVGAEKQWHQEEEAGLILDAAFERIDQAIAISTIYCANRIGAKAIAALTETGTTTQWMSRMNTDIPIFGLSRHAATLQRMTLYRGVHPVEFDVTAIAHTDVTKEVLDQLQTRRAVEPGDKVIITKGDLHGLSGGTNGMKIVTVGELVAGVE